MYKVSRVNDYAVGATLIEDKQEEVKQGQIIIAGRKQMNGFLAKVVLLGKHVTNPEKNDNAIDVSIGDIILVDRDSERFARVNDVLIINTFEIEAIVEKSDSPNVPTPDTDKKIDSKVSVD